MSWQPTTAKEEKIRFIADWLGGEYDFSHLCKRYGISRKTGYKFVHRYKAEGGDAFKERSPCRHHHPNETSGDVKERLIALKHRFPHWGPIKLRDWLCYEEPMVCWPAASTIGDILKREGLVKARRGRRRVPAYGAPFGACIAPNQIWSADFKGNLRWGIRAIVIRSRYPIITVDFCWDVMV